MQRKMCCLGPWVCVWIQKSIQQFYYCLVMLRMADIKTCTFRRWKKRRKTGKYLWVRQLELGVNLICIESAHKPTRTYIPQHKHVCWNLSSVNIINICEPGFQCYLHKTLPITGKNIKITAKMYSLLEAAASSSSIRTPINHCRIYLKATG